MIVVAQAPTEGSSLSLASSNLGDSEREEFKHISAKRIGDTNQKIKEEAKTWSFAGAEFLTALTVGAQFPFLQSIVLCLHSACLAGAETIVYDRGLLLLAGLV